MPPIPPPCLSPPQRSFLSAFMLESVKAVSRSAKQQQSLKKSESEKAIKRNKTLADTVADVLGHEHFNTHRNDDRCSSLLHHNHDTCTEDTRNVIETFETHMALPHISDQQTALDHGKPQVDRFITT